MKVGSISVDAVAQAAARGQHAEQLLRSRTKGGPRLGKPSAIPSGARGGSMKSLEALANKTKRTRDQAQSKRDQQVRAAVKRSQDEVAISHQGVDIKV